MGNFSAPPSQQTLLITGTDTEVGKTVLTSALAAYWRQYHPQTSLGLMKLLQTGVGDEEHYQALFRDQTHWQLVTPLRFTAPLAPPIAAAQEGKTVDLALLWQALIQLQSKHSRVLVEALGGLGSPVTPELTVADIAGLWRLPTLLVAPVKLGCLGQIIAHVALARQCQVPLKGIVLSCRKKHAEEQLQAWADPHLIESFTQIPVLGVIPHFKEKEALDPLCLAQKAADLDLEQLRGVFDLSQT